MQPFPGTGDTSARLRGVIGGPARSALAACDDQDRDDDDNGLPAYSHKGGKMTQSHYHHV